MTKELIRQKFKNRLNKAKDSQNKLYMDLILNKKIEILLQQIISNLKKQKRKPHSRINILLYFPLDIEFNCLKLLNKFKKQKNTQIFLPFMSDINLKMVEYRLPLGRQAFGIYQPNGSLFRNNKLDIAIIPVLGIDMDFRRIGFGKGIYDRFFMNLKKQPITIFVSRALNYHNSKITQYHDVKTSIYITPFATIKDKIHDSSNIKFRSISTNSRFRRLPSFTQNIQHKL
ncbi:5-formyltetrahydrofolate cyclo-ligase [Helicobacter sp. WB40]|uniref:5-formyltetrahydrofolate cyclo-ligase n=1 Tax=Helicobacter sp. WB40 TaxID=3004130 RepID=UPI0022EBF31E|nr:5-formyltetrahydrofolate cyclo-ligase [Helicobacter sp. WB40]MDA3967190.1 5-formyltetrahydrofolate cyclo-ligase [Helicobacter sp. WB40]